MGSTSRVRLIGLLVFGIIVLVWMIYPVGDVKNDDAAQQTQHNTFQGAGDATPKILSENGKILNTFEGGNTHENTRLDADVLNIPDKAAKGYSISVRDDFNISWKIVNKQEIHFSLSLGKKAWVALGLSPETGHMINSDIYIAHFSADETGELKGVVDDRFCMDYSLPPLDGAQGGRNDVLHYTCIQDDKKTVANFSRKLNTGDQISDFQIKNADMKLIWAFGDDNTLAYHGINNGHDCINLITGDNCAM